MRIHKYTNVVRPSTSSFFHTAAPCSKSIDEDKSNKKSFRVFPFHHLPSEAPGVALSAVTAAIGFTLAKYGGEGMLSLQGIYGAKSPISGI